MSSSYLDGGSRVLEQSFWGELNQQKRLILQGKIVISVGLFGHSGDQEVWEGKDEGTVTKIKEMPPFIMMQV